MKEHVNTKELYDYRKKGPNKTVEESGNSAL